VFACTAQGTTLHEWQVRNPDLWVNFFEFLSQKARRLSMGLSVGTLDRVTFEEKAQRLTVLLDEERAVLVRSHESTGNHEVTGNETGGLALKTTLEDWLNTRPLQPGCSAIVVRFPDQSVAVRTAEETPTPGALDNASRCAADVFRVLKVHRLPARRLHWRFAGGDFRFARRQDDLQLGVLADAATDEPALWLEFLQFRA
jgi:hypothetical protein